MVEIVIREATESDLPAILVLYDLLEQDASNVLTVEEACEVFARFKAYPDYRLYVAVSDNEIVGTFTLLIMDSLPHKGAPSGIVESVVVREDMRGKGIGGQLMRFARQRCAEAGCYKLVLSSNKINRPAHRFYETIGFQQYGYSFMVALNTDDRP